MKSLTYIFDNSTVPFSFHPLDGDKVQNAVVTSAMISTLLGTDESHRRVSSLAESWTNSKDYMSWQFQLRSGLSCEDGSPIDASHFVDSFAKVLRIHATKNPNVTAFSKLVGWNKFIGAKGEALEGLKALDAQTVEFRFSQPMNDGLLAFLSIPHFGFYCSKNFTESGEWRTDGKFTSSGPYQLESLVSDTEVALKLRESWPTKPTGMPQSVTIKQVAKFESGAIQDPNTFVVVGSQSTEFQGSDFEHVTGAKIVLRSMVLSPFMENLFSNKKNRQIFASRIRDWHGKHPIPGDGLSVANALYANTVPFQSERTSALKYETAGSPKAIRMVIGTSIPESVVKYYVEAVRFALEGSGVEVTTENLDRTQKDAIQKFLSNKDFDIRLMSSVIGGGLNNWIVDMMFCSDLGVRLPDSDGKICNLVKAQELNPLDEQEYASAFNRLLSDQASVLPLHHAGQYWAVGKNLDASLISPLSPSANIEKLRIK